MFVFTFTCLVLTLQDQSSIAAFCQPVFLHPRCAIFPLQAKMMSRNECTLSCVKTILQKGKLLCDDSELNVFICETHACCLSSKISLHDSDHPGTQFFLPFSERLYRHFLRPPTQDIKEGKDTRLSKDVKAGCGRVQFQCSRVYFSSISSRVGCRGKNCGAISEAKD